MRLGMTFISALFLLGLAACQTGMPDYVPPADMQGKACANECQAGLEDCKQAELAGHEACAKDDVIGRRATENCELARGNLPIGCMPSRTCATPDFKACREAFEQCWIACGGKVERGGT